MSDKVHVTKDGRSYMLHSDGQQPSEFTQWESCYTGMRTDCRLYDNYDRWCPKKPIWAHEVKSILDLFTLPEDFNEFMELLWHNWWVVFIWYKFW